MNNKKLYTIIFLITLFITCVSGQTENQIIPGERKHMTIVTEPASLYKGYIRMGIISSYYVVDKYFDSEGQKKYFIENAWARTWTLQFLAQYGITDRLQIDVFIPYKNEARYYSNLITSPVNNQDIDESWNLRGSGLGDISISTRYQIIQENDRLPSLTGDIGINLPTGQKNPSEIIDDYNYKIPTGYGEVSTDFRLQARKIIYPYAFKLYLDYSYSFGGNKFFTAADTVEKSFRSAPRTGIGASASILLNDWIAMTHELNYFTYAKSTLNGVQQDDGASGVSYESRLVFQIRQFRIGEAISLPLKAYSSGADPIYVILVQYVF